MRFFSFLDNNVNPSVVLSRTYFLYAPGLTSPHHFVWWMDGRNSQIKKGTPKRFLWLSEETKYIQNSVCLTDVFLCRSGTWRKLEKVCSCCVFVEALVFVKQQIVWVHFSYLKMQKSISMILLQFLWQFSLVPKIWTYLKFLKALLWNEIKEMNKDKNVNSCE